MKSPPGKPLARNWAFFERWLTLWVFLSIVAGIALGQLLPAPVQLLGKLEVAQVNLPVGLLIWLMIIPMLMKIDFSALHQVKKHWRGIGVTLFINWGGEAVFHGAAGLAVHSRRIRALAAGRADRQLYRRADPAGRRALHRHGVRVEQPVQGRSAVYPVAGGAQRHHHGVRFRARWSACCSAWRPSPCRGIPCSSRW